MEKTRCGRVVTAVLLSAALGAPVPALSNGGPFVIKYPNGDPAARGILARIDPDLKPGREERLRVVKEDLKILFLDDGRPPLDDSKPPLAHVEAAYTIENPTGSEVSVEFGFPILRGIYLSPLAMVPMPDVQVRLDDQHIQARVISNSAIYGTIRMRAREAIEKAIAADPELARLVAAARASGFARQRAREAVLKALAGNKETERAAAADRALASLLASESDAKDPDRAAARKALADHLAGKGWSAHDAGILVEYAGLDFSADPSPQPSRPWYSGRSDPDVMALECAHLGPLASIGDQKATQFLAGLSARFDPTIASTYEAIFAAWGGDVRERSLDLRSGEVRPREITVKQGNSPVLADPAMDPTVYARIDYLDANARISAGEKESCQAILVDLPVVFTFAPMNLLHYQVKFPAGKTVTLSVAYRQYAYLDTREPRSWQIAYVVHPASLWKEFGPIGIEVAAPPGVAVAGSMPLGTETIEERDPPKELYLPSPLMQKKSYAIRRATLDRKEQKTGEVFFAVDAEAWTRSRPVKVAEKGPAAGR